MATKKTLSPAEIKSAIKDIKAALKEALIQAEARDLLAAEPDVSGYGQAPAKPAARAVARKPGVAARR